MTPLICYHFAATTLRDGTPLPKKGERLRLKKGNPIMCERGYHGSVRVMDALAYAPGTMIARIKLSGAVLTQNDKACATVRTNLTDYVDATRTLHEFAIWCARGALARIPNPDPRSIKALNVKEEWLRGEATDDELAAARAAAWAAARAAARTAARTAAWAAAWDAAWDAAWAAAWDAAWVAAWDAQNTELERRLNALWEARDAASE